MAEAHPAPGTREPWTQRLVARPPWSPLRLSLAIGLGLAALFLIVEAALGRLAVVFAPDPTHARGDFRVALVLIASVAYLPSALAHAVRGARETIDRLAPALRCSPAELAALREASGRFDAPALRRAGGIGVLAMLLVPLTTNLTIETWAISRLPPEALVHRLLLPWLGWFLGRFVYALLVESQRLSRIGRELVRVDLLDLRPLAPIARQGLRHALLSAGLLAILALALIDVDIAPNLLSVLAAGLTVNAILSAVLLLLPARGVSRAIAAAKERELEWCAAELRRSREGAPGARPLADLVSWRSFVASVPEWPFDAPTLTRFALYLAIPLGSWLGGALVEHLVDRLLS
jgi:hypothetical protein